jgi:hypothetical protein
MRADNILESLFMSDVYKFGKKLFTLSVVAVTIAWSMGLAALVPAVAQAAEECPTLEAGDLFRVPDSSQPTSVYLVTSQLKRKAFPYESVYKSYYKDFSGVEKIGMSCTDAYPSNGFVTYRAGSALVKSAISPSIYAVLPGGELSKIGSPEVAAALYGANWEDMYLDLPDIFFDAYSATGAALTTAVPHEGMLVKVAGSDDTYYVMDGKRHKVEGALSVTASSVRTVTQAVMDTVEMASTTVTEAEVVSSVSASAPGEETPVGGNATVSLAATTAAADQIPGGSQNVPYFSFNVKAGDKDAVVDSITLTRAGLGSDNDFKKVYLYYGDMRLGGGK